MSLIILLDSLKIHKMRHERTIQLWFIMLYLINLLPLILPFGDKDFSALYLAVENMLSGDLNVPPAWELLTPGNWLTLGIFLLTGLITLFFSLIYATLYVGERENMQPKEAVLRCLSALPKLFLFALILFIPAMLSALLAFFPLIIFLFMIYFLPLMLTIERKPLLTAIKDSYAATRHQKLSIFFKVLILSFILRIPQTLIQAWVQAPLPLYILSTFFTVLKAFIYGRLMGILYVHIVMKVPFMLPSKSDTTE